MHLMYCIFVEYFFFLGFRLWLCIGYPQASWAFRTIFYYALLRSVDFVAYLQPSLILTLLIEILSLPSMQSMGEYLHFVEDCNEPM